MGKYEEAKFVIITIRNVEMRSNVLLTDEIWSIFDEDCHLLQSNVNS